MLAMTMKNARIVLFASLIVAMILSFGIAEQSVSAQKIQTVEDNRMVNELQKIVSNVGKTTERKTLSDGTALKLVTTVTQTGDNEYDVKAKTVTNHTNGEKTKKTITYSVKNPDGTFVTTTEDETLRFVAGSSSARDVNSGWSQSIVTPSDTGYLDDVPYEGVFLSDEDGHCMDGKKYKVFGTVQSSGTSYLTWAVDGWVNAYCIIPQPLDDVTMRLNSLQINPATSTNGHWAPSHNYGDQYITLSGVFRYNW